MKTQTSFYQEKSRSTSKEDADPFYFEEKFRSTSKEDADLFYCEEKNSNLRLRKMQIYIILKKKS